MLIKAYQRGGGRALARYLLHNPDNEVVEVHDLRGFMAEDLVGALMEIDATARGTRSQKPIFSLSFNPPPDASISVEAFEKAFAVVEQRFGLQEQQRAVVFHEKPSDRGIYRRHVHVVYSRVTEANGRLKVLDLGPYKTILQRCSREIFQELGLEVPAGYKDRDRRDPSNYDRRTWQQAKRLGEDPRDVKALIRDCFLRSNSRESFERNLAPHLLFLARGDRRGFVLCHHSGEVISVSKYSGIKPRDLEARLGSPQDLQPISEVQERVKALLRAPDKDAIRRAIQEAKARQQEQLKALRAGVEELKARHRKERALLYARQHDEWKAGERERAERFRTGIIGVFDRLSGTRTKITRQNTGDRTRQKAAHRNEKQALIDSQLGERRELQARMTIERQRQTTERKTLREELAAAQPPRADAPRLRQAFDEAAPPQMGDPGYAAWREAQREITRDRRREGRAGGQRRDRGEGDSGRDRGPEIER